MKKQIINIFFRWLPVGISIISLSGLVYVSVQQSYRQGLNDPQISMVEDAQALLNLGKQPAEVVPRTPLFDIEKSLSPFIAVYDSNGTPLEASASLGSLTPKPPVGVFQHAKKKGENRVTWQPNANTRIAIVVKPIKDGRFVLAGRNMREVESRVDSLSKMTVLILIITLLLSFMAEVLGNMSRRRYSNGI